jgi:hypothetical protein
MHGGLERGRRAYSGAPDAECSIAFIRRSMAIDKPAPDNVPFLDLD